MDSRQRAWWFAGALGLTIAAAGCMRSSDNNGDSGGSSGSNPMTKPTQLPGTKSAASAALLQASDCGDLLSKIKNDVIAKIDAQAVLLKKGPEYAGYARGVYVNGGIAVPGVADGASKGGAEFGNGAPVPSDSAGAPSGGTGSGPVSSGSGGTGTSTMGQTGGGTTSSPTGHSDTNTQVKGVDEADIVKTDDKGENLYLVHGNTLFKLAAWPPESTSIDSSAPVEGQAAELFVNDGKVVVFSTIWNQGDIVPLKTDSGAGSYNGYYQPYYYGAPFTKITTFDVSGAEPKVERELYVEGSYLSSRRHGNTVRAIVQGGFHTPPVFQAYIEYNDPWGEAYPQEDIDAQVDDWRDRLVARIEATKISDWVPVERERIDGEIVEAKPRCRDFYAPPPALSSYGLTDVVSFDMSDPKSEIGGAVVLGSADTVYANDDTLVLAQRDWRYEQRFLEREQTVVHTFDLGADISTKYRASGFVPGHILNQFSLDVAGDTLRIATTQDIWQSFVQLLPLKSNVDDVPMIAERHTTDNRVITLQAKGEDLQRIGITPPLGKDGERIQSTRFVGDRGYVVTFLQKDPLIAIDLADAADPKILGALTIDGFSQYMHPMDDTHLLTIGRNTDANGSDIGLLLQIFDVSDATHPTRTSMFAYAPSGWSEAQSNHKAFTYWVPEGETDGLLAFPYARYDAMFSSTLQVFRVSVAKGFTQLGEIDHTPLYGNCYDVNGYPNYVYQYCQQPEVRRGLFIQDDKDTYVYSLSWGGVLVNALSDLTATTASVPLPAPDYSEHREGTVMTGNVMDSGGGVAVGGGTAGSTGTSTPPSMGTDVKPAPEPAADGGMAMSGG